ncbi:MAG: trypsin-like peptidase domain-containing protein [Hyphomonadaceae bacterium]|nr:trypsin-like peptidase domain-containing protein [Hyphomonadaceae bacterium]
MDAVVYEAGAVVRDETGSGVLVDRCLVLTARHVLGPPPGPGEERRIEVTWRPHLARRDAVSLGWTRRSARIVALGGGRGTRRTDLLDDWALIALDRPIKGIEPTPLDAHDCCAQSTTEPMALLGFPADHFERANPVPWVDPECRVSETLANGIVATSCQATSGNSGGPLLVLRAEGWRVAAVLTRANAPRIGGGVSGDENFAIPIDGFLRRVVARANLDASCGPWVAPGRS